MKMLILYIIEMASQHIYTYSVDGKIFCKKQKLIKIKRKEMKRKKL